MHGRSKTRVVRSIRATGCWMADPEPSLRAHDRPRSGQADIRTLTQPIPVVNTGGHSAPVRSLIFVPPDGGLLLSAGRQDRQRLGPAGGPSRRRPRRSVPGSGAATPARSTRWPSRPSSSPTASGSSPWPGSACRRTGRDRPLPVPRARTTADRRLLPLAPRRPTRSNPEGHTRVVNSLAFHPRGGFLASASDDRDRSRLEPAAPGNRRPASRGAHRRGERRGVPSRRQPSRLRRGRRPGHPLGHEPPSDHRPRSVSAEPARRRGGIPGGESSTPWRQP